MKKSLIALLIFLFATTLLIAVDKNYAKALQMSIYFYEAQESGSLSPMNRVPWRGPSDTNDGMNIAVSEGGPRDLSGGWYDAGDRWKANLTMGNAVTALNWGAIEWLDAYQSTGQLDYFTNGITYVMDYLQKCVDDPFLDTTNEFSSFKLWIDVAGSWLPHAGQPEPDLHDIWGLNEMVEGTYERHPYYITTNEGGSDIAGLMASAFASAAILYDTIGDSARASTYLRYARKIVSFIYASHERFTNIVVDNMENNNLTNGYVVDGVTGNNNVPIGYRYQIGLHGYDAAMYASLWLHRAEVALDTSSYGDEHLARAYDYYTNAISFDSDYFTIWKDLSASGHVLGVALLFLFVDPTGPHTTFLSNTVQGNYDFWTNDNSADVTKTPGGFYNRTSYGTNFNISSSVATHFLTLLYTKYDNADEAARFAWVKSQANYILGEKNGDNRSLVVGFGISNDTSTNQWFQAYLHNSASGSWTGWGMVNAGWGGGETAGKYFQPNNKHILYGALLLGHNMGAGFDGPHNTDRFHHKENEVAITANAFWQGVLAALVSKGYGTGSTRSNMPPPFERNTLTTNYFDNDRNFVVIAKRASQSPLGDSFTGYFENRSRWKPQRGSNYSCRYFFTLDDASIVGKSVSLVCADATNSLITHYDRDIYFVEIFFTNEVYPYWQYESPYTRYFKTATFTLSFSGFAGWDSANDFSFSNMYSAEGVVPNIAIYDNGVHIDGYEPERTPPLFITVSSPNDDGTYGTSSNSALTFVLHCDKDVRVTTNATPATLTLSSGGVAEYAGATNTNIYFTYTVLLGESANDLDVFTVTTNDMGFSDTYDTSKIVTNFSSSNILAGGRAIVVDGIAPIMTVSKPDGFRTNKAFTVYINVDENYGYWSTNALTGPYHQAMFGMPSSIQIGSNTTFYYFTSEPFNTTATNTNYYYVDTTPPLLSVSNVPFGNYTTNEAFTLSLYPNENYLYISFESRDGPYTDVSTNGTNILLSSTKTLYFYTDDGFNASETNAYTYTIDAVDETNTATNTAALASSRLVVIEPATARIAFDISSSASGRKVGEVTIVAIDGAPLVTVPFDTSEDRVVWDGKGSTGEPVRQGVYVYCIRYIQNAVESRSTQTLVIVYR